MEVGCFCVFRIVGLGSGGGTVECPSFVEGKVKEEGREGMARAM